MLITFIALAASPGLVAEELLVAVASNFTAPMRALVAEFEAETGHDVQLAFGSSGRFYAQIVNGAPYQVFLSADQEKPQQLEQAGLVVAGSRFTYATGRLALWSTSSAVSGAAVLRQPFTRIALANPAVAPYGKAAQEVLEKLDLVQATQSRWVLGENIAQAYQFVATGNAQLGFVALSQLRMGDSTQAEDAWVVPGEFHSAIHQDAVLLEKGASCAACKQLLAFLQTPETKNRIQAYGYQAQ